MGITGNADYLKRGDWNAACDRCGTKTKASNLRKEWDNLYVCSICFELRQPQDFVRATPDKQAPPWTRLMPLNDFAPATCTLEGISAVADFAIADCSIVDLVPSGLYYV